MAEYDFKSKIFNGTKTKARSWWEHKLLPAMVGIDFLFKIKFNLDKIKANYEDDRSAFNDIVRPNFLESSVLRKAKGINIPGFKALYVTYKGELDVYSLNFESKKPQEFGYTITIEATDSKKEYTKKEIESMVAKFVKDVEKTILKDSPYYKITK